MKKETRNLLIVVSLIGIVCLIPVIGEFMIECTKKLERNKVFSYYSFNTETILGEINQNTDGLRLIPDPDLTLSTNEVKVNWGLDEYLKVSKALQNKSGMPTGNDLILYYADFSLPCGNSAGELQSATFLFAKPSGNMLEGILGAYQQDWTVEIQPAEQYGYVYYSERYQGRRNSDQLDMNVSISHLLDVAEEQGGSHVRQMTGNACEIDITSARWQPTLWIVEYSDLKGSKRYVIDEDPIKGTFTVERNDFTSPSIIQH